MEHQVFGDGVNCAEIFNGSNEFMGIILLCCSCLSLSVDRISDWDYVSVDV